MQMLGKVGAGFLVAAAVLGAAPAANADGPAGRSYEPRETYAPYNWGGLYIGGSVGGAWSDVDVSNAGPGVHYYRPGDVYSFDNSGWIAGGHIGFNHQVNHWVFGIEASLSGGNLDDKLVAPGVFAINTYKTDIQWLFTGTGRIGYAWDNILGYVKGGYASARLETSATEVPAFAHSGESHEQHNGWVVGAGVEYLLTPNVVLGVEYNYIDLEARTYRGVDFSNFSTYDVRVDPDAIQTVTARLSFKFGRGEERYEPMK
jgi:outer membrane immunogenic protein